ncbi:hypothetical protein HF319_01160 [Xanthomonas sp. Kuri4-1]
MSHTVGGTLTAAKNTVQGALKGNVDDIAKVAIVAGMATSTIPVATGVAALAGNSAVGALIDVFA